jgi:hypothetical protein
MSTTGGVIRRGSDGEEGSVGGDPIAGLGGDVANGIVALPQGRAVGGKGGNGGGRWGWAGRSGGDGYIVIWW